MSRFENSQGKYLVLYDLEE